MEKRFTIVVRGPAAVSATEQSILRSVCVGKFIKLTDVQVWENNKLHHCDGCGKQRRDVKSCGKDANGDADAPDLCFICRKEAARGRQWDYKLNRYVHFIDLHKEEVPF